MGRTLSLLVIRHDVYVNIRSFTSLVYAPGMQKRTPKKFYSTNQQIPSSSCRLCLKICDVTHVKKLFRPANANILKLAEDCLGDVLVRDENLPQNICKPCERRLLNYKAFKELILKSQDAVKSQSRVKRCPEPSPSSLPARKRVHQEASSTRRTLLFSSKENTVSLKTNFYCIRCSVSIIISDFFVLAIFLINGL